MNYSVNHIKLNKYSRPGIKLNGVKKIVVHWTANPGASAENHQRYFNNLTGRYASAHIFVDADSVVEIVPLNEVCYHANDGTKRGVSALKPNANYLSIGVELCVEKNGSFHPNTLKQAAEVFAKLCKQFGLTEKDIVRHYDITGKNCPAPWVSRPNEFDAFKSDVARLLRPAAPKPVAPVKSGNVGKLVIIDAATLNIRSKPSWSDSAVCGSVKKGQAFTIAEELPEFYKLKSGVYITKSTKYVHVK